MDGLAFSREVMREAAIWYHIKSTADRGLFNRGAEILCLKAKHMIKTVGDTETLARRFSSQHHRNRPNCACPACAAIRTECPQCSNPHKCYRKARDLLNSLEDKWNPLPPQPEDYEDAPGQPFVLTEKEAMFNPKITTGGTTPSEVHFLRGG